MKIQPQQYALSHKIAPSTLAVFSLANKAERL